MDEVTNLTVNTKKFRKSYAGFEIPSYGSVLEYKECDSSRRVCLTVYNIAMNWDDAEMFCMKHTKSDTHDSRYYPNLEGTAYAKTGHLAVVKNYEDQLFVSNTEDYLTATNRKHFSLLKDMN